MRVAITKALNGPGRGRLTAEASLSEPPNMRISIEGRRNETL